MSTMQDRIAFGDEVFFKILRTQCEYAIMSTANHDVALASLKENESQSVKVRATLLKEIFYNLENFLNYTAKASFILWPHPSKADRGLRLRSTLGVGDNHPLKDRAARNHLQHFDERLDEWILENKTGFVDSNLGPRTMIMSHGAPSPVLRHYDPVQRIFTFRNSDYDIAAMEGAVRDVLNKLDVVAPDPLAALMNDS